MNTLNLSYIGWVTVQLSLFRRLQNKSQSLPLSLSFFVHSIARAGWFTIYQVNSKSRVTSQITQQWVLGLTQSHNKLHTIERDNSVYIDLVYRTSRVRVSVSLTLTCILSFSLKKMAKCRLNFAQAFSQRCSFLAVLSECLSVTFKESVYAALLHRSRSSVSLPTQQRIWRFLGPVHTNPDIFENEDNLHPQDFRPHVYNVFGHQKCRFSKPVPRKEFFENAGFNIFFAWKDENGGYFRIRRCHTSYSVWHEWDAIEATQKNNLLFQSIRIRVDETCVVSYRYSYTRITRMTKVIHEPLRSHDSGRFLVQSILSCRELWSMTV